MSKFSFLCFVTLIYVVSKAESQSELILPADVESDVACHVQADFNKCGSDYSGRKRFYWDILMEDCVQFAYGKCDNSINVFTTKKACRNSCRESGLHPLSSTLKLPPVASCMLQPDSGFCVDYHPKFYFDIKTRQCRGFAYSGCGGNFNQFDDIDTCDKTCFHHFTDFFEKNIENEHKNAKTEPTTTQVG